MDVPSEPFADAVILAAGSSTRMNGYDKLLMEIGGQPLFVHTMRAVAAATTVRRIVLVARADRVELFAAMPFVRELDAMVVAGGERRQDSVARGVAATSGEVILIHDGARALIDPEVVDRVAHTARRHGAAVPVVAVPESMRRLQDGRIVELIPRDDLYRSQTPHGARRDILLATYAHHDPHGPTTFIDETTLVQAAGFTVTTVPGDPVNLKVTLPGDETLVIALLEARARADRHAGTARDPARLG